MLTKRLFIFFLIFCSLYFVFLSSVPLAQVLYQEHNREFYLVLLDAILYLLTAVVLLYYALSKIL